MINWNRGLLMAPNDGGEGAAPLPPTPAPPAPTPPPAAVESAPEAPPVDAPPAAPPLTLSKEQLDARMEQVRRSQLRDLGFDSPEELSAMRERDAAATKATEDARRAQQTREQQLTEDVTKRTQERDAAQAEADDLRFQGHVSSICATQGIKNVDYAQFAIGRAAEAVPEGEQLDVEAWLAERMNPEAAEHQALRTALGVAPPTATVASPHTTIPGEPPPQPPPAGGTGPAVEDAFALDDATWQARREAYGV